MPDNKSAYHGRRSHVQGLDTFDAACRAADAKHAAERPDDHLGFLRRLMADDNSSLGATYYKIQQRHFTRAAASTIEALMFQLREGGIAVLKEAPAMRRLAALSEPQLHEICARLQKLKPEIAEPWSPDDVVWLIKAWAKCHGR